MASYQIRQRDPLVDQNTAAMLERRGRELVGAGLVVLALLFAVMLGSYSASDPGWLVATDAPVNNWLGRFGASVSSTLFIIGGLGSWGIPLLLGAWGVRFMAHRGDERAMGRVVFAVIAIALGSVFAATHVPGPNWPHAAIGLGGLFGDTVLGAMLAILPIGAGFGLKLLSVFFGVGLVVMALFVTGFDMVEIRAIRRFITLGMVSAYAMGVSLAGQSAAGTARAAQALAEKNRARREMAASRAQRDDVIYSEPMQPAQLRADKSLGMPGAADFGRPASLRPNARRAPEMHAHPAPAHAAPRMVAERYPERAAEKAAEKTAEQAAQKPGLLARVPQMIRRAAAAHQMDTEMAAAAMANVPSEDRIKARINDVIRARVRQPSNAAQPTVQSAVQAALARREPPVMGRRGPVPLIATPRHKQAMELPPEPPVLTQSSAAPLGANMARLSVTSATSPAKPAAM